MSKAQEVGKQLVELCRQGNNLEAVNRLYDDNVISSEAIAGQGFPREMSGKKEVTGKNQWWFDNHEIHSTEVSDPFPHGDNKFAVIFKFDVTFKPQSQRMQLEEVGLYEVADGKVIKEEFFYSMG